MTTNERDELAELAETIRTGSLGTSEIADALLTAGYRKPRTITTAEELDALPGESVIRDAGGMVFEKDFIIGDPSDWWWIEPDREGRQTNSAIALPATVLHTPGAAL